MLLKFLHRFLFKFYPPRTCILEMLVHSSLGNKFPKSKVLTVFKLVKVTQVSFAGHKTVPVRVTQMYNIQIYCLSRPLTKKMSSLNSILTISRLKFESVTVTMEN